MAQRVNKRELVKYNTWDSELVAYINCQAHKFDKLYAKQAFFYWYDDLNQLAEAREELASITSDYNDGCLCCMYGE